MPEETIIEKVSNQEIREIVPQPSIEVKHNIDELIEKRDWCLEQRDVYEAIANDCQILIDKAKQAGCIETPVVEIPEIIE